MRVTMYYLYQIFDYDLRNLLTSIYNKYNETNVE